MRLATACAAAGLAWVVCEVAGGLAFLAMGIRLWRYHLMPVWWDITSPIVWMFAATLCIAPLSRAFERRWTQGLGVGARMARLAAFVGTIGPVLEVLLNELGFKGLVGRGLYRIHPSWLILWRFRIVAVAALLPDAARARPHHGPPVARALIRP